MGLPPGSHPPARGGSAPARGGGRHWAGGLKFVEENIGLHGIPEEDTLVYVRGLEPWRDDTDLVYVFRRRQVDLLDEEAVLSELRRLDPARWGSPEEEAEVGDLPTLVRFYEPEERGSWAWAVLARQMP